MNPLSGSQGRVLAGCVGLLLLLWCAGLFGRGLWTPDEPREAALAASMIAGWAALPSLAGEPFAEKPPLAYWLSGQSMQWFGLNAAAARLPQLGYALIGFLAVLVLARRLLGSNATAHGAAAAAAMMFATGALVYQVQIWLDTDALLLAGVTVALAGMYVALHTDSDAAGQGHARWRGYLVMHTGLALVLFAKNLAGGLVPALTLLCYIAWERRWRELARWELYVGALIPAAGLAGWAGAVAARPNGMMLLHVLFWNNLLGRALPIAATAGLDYSSGHPNWPGKYLVELPLYLLPWTPLVAAALWAAWRGARRAGPQRSAWRFALCAAVPGLLLLSLASTARGIYAAPCMVGFALLVAVWAVDAVSAPRVLAITAILITLLAALVMMATLALQWTVERASAPVLLICVLAAVSVMVASVRWALARQASVATQLLRLAAAWCVLLSLGTLSVLGAINRTQDLPALAERVAQAAGPNPLLLWDADETTLAWAQLYLPAGRWSAINAADATAPAELARRLRAAPDLVVVSLVPGRGWSWARWREYLRGRERTTESGPWPRGQLAPPPALPAAGLQLSHRVERPGGRAYFLWRRRGGAP